MFEERILLLIMFLRYNIDSDVIKRFKSSNTHWCDTRVKPFAADTSLMCDKRFECAKYITMDIVLKQHFNHLFYRPLKKCFLVTDDKSMC